VTKAKAADVVRSVVRADRSNGRGCVWCFIKSVGFSRRQWKRGDRERGTLPRYGYKILAAGFTQYRHGGYVVPAGRCHSSLLLVRQSRYCARKFKAEFFDQVVTRTGVPGRVILLRWTSFFRATSKFTSTRTNREPLHNLRKKFVASLVNLTQRCVSER